MAHPTRIEGTVTLSDGREVKFSIGADLGWQQWGATQETCGETVGLMDALATAAGDEGLRGEDEDA